MRSRLARLGPPLALWLLAPWVAECAWGGFTAAEFPSVVVVLAPMYGGAALLIREVARRTGGGWPVIVLLAAAFGVFQPGLVDQSLFNPNYLDDTQFAEHAVTARETWVPGLELSASQLLSYVTGHVALSICAPIAIVESFVSPERRHLPWLRWPGLVAVPVLYVLGSLLIHFDTDNGFTAGATQRAVAMSAVVALIAAAFLAARHARGRRAHRTGTPPRLWVVAVTAAVLKFVADPALAAWWGVALGVAACVMATVLFGRWSRRSGWGQPHVFAGWAAPLVAAAAFAYTVPTYEPASPAASIVGDIAITVIVAALVGGAWWRLSAERGR